MRGVWRFRRRPVVTHNLVNGRGRRQPEDERQRRSPPGPPDAGAIVDNRPVTIAPGALTCSNSGGRATYKNRELVFYLIFFTAFCKE